MTEVSIVVLALACIIQGFNYCKLFFRVKELEETVGSHWSATQREINIIWGNINGVEYYDGEEEKEEETNGEDGAAEM